MPSYNRVIIMGNLTRDPEIKYTPKGTAVCEISIAVNRTWKDDQGNKQEKTSFFAANAWGRTAEVIAEHFNKGKPIFIEGELTQESWDDKATGKKREKTKIRIERFEFIGGKDAPQAGQPSQRPAEHTANQQRRTSAPAEPYVSPEDDCPF